MSHRIHRRHRSISNDAMLRRIRIALDQQIDGVLDRGSRVSELRQQFDKLKVLLADYLHPAGARPLHSDRPPASRRRRQRLTRR